MRYGPLDSDDRGGSIRGNACDVVGASVQALATVYLLCRHSVRARSDSSNGSGPLRASRPSLPEGCYCAPAPYPATCPASGFACSAGGFFALG
jgi:hypothetical protein